MYNDLQATQQWEKDHREQIMRSFENTKADAAAVRTAIGWVMNKLGTRFVRQESALQPRIEYRAHLRPKA